MKQQLTRLIDCGVERVRSTLDGIANRKYERTPLCGAPLAPSAEYERRWVDARHRAYPAVDGYEQECAAAIEPEWFHRLALLTQVTIKDSEICYQHGRLLYATLVRYARSRGSDNLTVVETGTARGFSALCMARALSDAGATGKIVSFDVLPHDVRILWNCVRDIDGPRSRAELLQDYADLIAQHLIFHRGDTKRELEQMYFPRINLAFLDSVHTYAHVMAEFSSIRDRQKAGDILFFDDYTPEAYPGVVRAADEICLAQGYAKTVVTANTQRQYLIAEKR